MVYVKLQKVECACGWTGEVFPGDTCESCGGDVKVNRAIDVEIIAAVTEKTRRINEFINEATLRLHTDG